MTASYEVWLKRSAEKELRSIPGPNLSRIVGRIRDLSGTPRPRGCEKMEGRECYRIRQGDWRILYEIDDPARRVTVIKIGHRREIYR